MNSNLIIKMSPWWNISSYPWVRHAEASVQSIWYAVLGVHPPAVHADLLNISIWQNSSTPLDYAASQLHCIQQQITSVELVPNTVSDYTKRSQINTETRPADYLSYWDLLTHLQQWFIDLVLHLTTVSTVWNSLPDELRNSDSFNGFKWFSKKKFFSAVTSVTSALQVF